MWLERASCKSLMDDFEWISYTFDLDTDSTNSAGKVPYMDKFLPEAPRATFQDKRSSPPFSDHHFRLNKRRSTPESSTLEISPPLQQHHSSTSYFTSAPHIPDTSQHNMTQHQVEQDHKAELQAIWNAQEVSSPNSPEGGGEINQKYDEGRWRPDEIAMLLHVAREFAAQELKIIGDISFFVGVKRPRRAIDKQLKRMLKYDKWASRDLRSLETQLTGLINSGEFGRITQEQTRKIHLAKDIWYKRNLPSTSSSSSEPPKLQPTM